VTVVHTSLRPAEEAELSRMVADCAARGVPLEIQGAGTKRRIGKPVAGAARLSTGGLAGITLYEPADFVLTARAGTPVADIGTELARHSQMLAFEPIDLGPVVGGAPRVATWGAVFATNVSGARRIASGTARDHLLGTRAVDGRGELFRSGGRVLKNATGYDLARGLAGSWGTLAVISEAVCKVVPAPEQTATLVLFGLTDDLAGEVMRAAMGTPWEVSGAVHITKALTARLWHAALRAAGAAVTAFRLETFSRWLVGRIGGLREALAPYGEVHVLDDASSRPFWDELRQLSILQNSEKPLWRISTTPRLGPRIVEAIAGLMETETFYDWAGGLIWLAVPPAADAGASDVRQVVALYGGHATLIRAEGAVRAAVDVFQPLEPSVERLTRQLKVAFDPAGILNPGRMYATM
jgi:glycolate oxidase FAD binding subunit